LSLHAMFSSSCLVERKWKENGNHRAVITPYH